MNASVAEAPVTGSAHDDQLLNRLLYQRIVVLGTEVNDPVANRLCAQLLLLSAEDPRRDISLYINSPGGSVTAGLAIYDTMQLIPNDVSTLAMGLAASMGQFLLCAGTRGQALQPAARPGADAPGLGRASAAPPPTSRSTPQQLERTSQHHDPADRPAHRAAGGRRSPATASGTAGSAPRRPSSTGSSTTSWSASTTSARSSSAARLGAVTMSQYTIPTVVEKTPTGERAFDIYSRLLSDRIIFIGTEIDDGVANVVMAQLLHLEFASPDLEIGLYINSPGGSYSALTAIYDTMQFIRPRGRHDLHGPGVIRGRGAAGGGRAGQAVGAGARQGAAAPALQPGSGHPAGPGHPGQGGGQGAGRDRRDPQPAHRPPGRQDQERHRPEQDVHAPARRSATAWPTMSSPAARPTSAGTSWHRPHQAASRQGRLTRAAGGSARSPAGPASRPAG